MKKQIKKIVNYNIPIQTLACILVLIGILTYMYWGYLNSKIQETTDLYAGYTFEEGRKYQGNIDQQSFVKYQGQVSEYIKTLTTTSTE